MDMNLPKNSHSTSKRRSFPGFDRLYEPVGLLSDSTTYRGYIDATDDEESALLRGDWLPGQPLSIKWHCGRGEPLDFACGGPSWIVYISQRIQRLLVEEQLTGWSTYPIALHNKAGNICDGYAGLSITGRCGPQDDQRGVLIPGQEVDTKFPLYRGIYFDEATWDGSDFFYLGKSVGGFYVTDAVRLAFERHEIKVFDFVPMCDAE